MWGLLLTSSVLSPLCSSSLAQRVVPDQQHQHHLELVRNANSGDLIQTYWIIHSEREERRAQKSVLISSLANSDAACSLITTALGHWWPLEFLEFTDHFPLWDHEQHKGKSYIGFFLVTSQKPSTGSVQRKYWWGYQGEKLDLSCERSHRKSATKPPITFSSWAVLGSLSLFLNRLYSDHNVFWLCLTWKLWLIFDDSAQTSLIFPSSFLKGCHWANCPFVWLPCPPYKPLDGSSSDWFPVAFHNLHRSWYRIDVTECTRSGQRYWV